MKFRSTIMILLVLLMVSSIFFVNTAPSMTTDNKNTSFTAPQAPQTLAAIPNVTPPHILVYTEFVDDRSNQEYENTMAAINNTYGTDYQQTNLTDYNNLASSLPGKDILLIPEQELATSATMKAVGTLWASTLDTFVNDGGVVILLDFGNVSAPGLTLHIYNESSLMQFGPVLGQYPSAALTEMHRHTFGDALCRRIEYRWTPLDHTFAITNTDGNNAIDDYSTDNRVVIHKTLGRGHIVFMGFDLQYTGPNYEQIVGNAIRLPNHVVFDASQQTEYRWEFPPPNPDGYQGAAFVEDLLDEGFAVSRMDTFSAAFLNASDVVICTLPWDAALQYYDAAEIAVLDAYVADGGSIFIQADWGSFSAEIEDLINNFGYYLAKDSIWDTDDLQRYWQESQVYYTGDNLLSHPITTNVERVEFYASDGFSTMPSNVEKIIVSDWDGTTCWGDDGWGYEWLGLDGITTMAVSKYGAGRVCVVLDGNFMDGINDEDADGAEDYFDSDNDVLLMNAIHWLAGYGASNDAPQLSGLTHEPSSPIHGDPITVNVTAFDSDGLDNITCYYRDNLGAWQNVSMTPLGGDLYTAAIGTFNSSEEKDYYVRAFDSSSDEMESVSDVVYLNGINYFPETPMLYDPGTTDNDGVFLLNWTVSVDADGSIDHYEIHVSNHSQFATTLDIISVDTDYHTMTVFEDDNYYFRVRAVDDDGAVGFWSFQQWINVVIIPGPAISTPDLSPAAPVHGDSVGVSVDVTDQDGVKNVTCYYSVNSGAWQNVSMTYQSGDTYNCSLGTYFVDDVVEYYIKAYDNSTSYNPTTTSIYSFEILNQAPTEPTLYDPGTIISTSNFFVNWTAGTDLENAIDHYELQMSNSSSFTVILDQWSVFELGHEVSVLTDGIYYFRVKTVDDHGAYSPYSNIESITVDTDPPMITLPFHTPTTPYQGDVVTISVNATDISGIFNVTLHYRVNSGTYIAVVMENVYGDTFELSIGSFMVDDTIQYYVQAFDNTPDSDGIFSIIQWIHIENQAPTAPDLLDPGTSISVSHVIVNWTAGSDLENALDHYQLQVSVSNEFTVLFAEWNTTSLSYNVTDLLTGTFYFRVRVFDDHDAASPWSDIESIDVNLGSATTTTTTRPTVPSTTTTTADSPFDPDVLNLVFLAVSVGSLLIVLMVVVGIIRQRSRAQRQYNLYMV
ncbi:MAG: hypothetical protein ACFFEE_01875 [Candidatus Thorarchaeota archaeon]